MLPTACRRVEISAPPTPSPRQDVGALTALVVLVLVLAGAVRVGALIAATCSVHQRRRVCGASQQRAACISAAV